MTTPKRLGMAALALGVILGALWFVYPRKKNLAFKASDEQYSEANQNLKKDKTHRSWSSDDSHFFGNRSIEKNSKKEEEAPLKEGGLPQDDGDVSGGLSDSLKEALEANNDDLDLKDTYRQVIEAGFAKFFDDNKISDDQRKKVMEVLINQQAGQQNLGMMLLDGTTSDEKIIEEQNNLMAKRDEQLSKIMDQQQVQNFKKYEDEAPKRLVRDMNESSIGELGLPSDVTESVVNVLSAIDQEYMEEHGWADSKLSPDKIETIRQVFTQDPRKVLLERQGEYAASTTRKIEALKSLPITEEDRKKVQNLLEEQNQLMEKELESFKSQEKD